MFLFRDETIVFRNYKFAENIFCKVFDCVFVGAFLSVVAMYALIRKLSGSVFPCVLGDGLPIQRTFLKLSLMN